MAASGRDWLTARPIAHRGLHDAASGVIENTAAAVAAAADAGYGIELDLQISTDGEAMVHHDDALGRLTEGSGALASMTAAALRAVRFRAGEARISTLGEICDLVAGRVPLVLELKSRFDGDTRIAQRAAAVLASYAGPAAAMSFDPLLVETLRGVAPGLRRGVVAERRYHDPAPTAAAADVRLGYLLHALESRPQIMAYSVADLPALAPWMARAVFGLPVLTWTVRTPQQAAHARRYADQIISRIPAIKPLYACSRMLALRRSS